MRYPLFIRVSTLFIFTTCATIITGAAQQPAPNPALSNPNAVPGAQLPKQLGGGSQAGAEVDEARRREMQKKLDEDRNKEIKKATDELLQLATDLKKSVDASVAGDTLSVQVIKKTDEIEKLAKKVRNKMKETYNEGPTMGKLPDASIH